MDDSAAPNIQNDFFNKVRKEKTRVAVFLNSGKRLTGRIKSFDKFTFLLASPQGEQIIFKHAVASVGPYMPASHEREGFNNRLSVENNRRPSRSPAEDEPEGKGSAEPAPQAGSRE